ncbi:MAG: tetratricopeptide repeat protein [Nevskia sp.]|nr:tetratricopeptide repeat protein [Nevskia sp.]
MGIVKLVRVALPGVAACTIGAVYGGDAGELSCDSVAQCGSLGAAAYKKGDYVTAQAYFEQQVVQYEQNGRASCKRTDCPESAVPYNNLALATLKAGLPLKARAWLEVAPEAAATRHNKDLVERALKDWKWPDTPAGEYWQYAGYGTWSTVTVTRDGEKWSIHYDGYRFPPTGLEAGPNIGEFDTDMPLAERKATYSDGNGQGCKVSIVFSSDHVTLDEDDSKGDCGFGYNVRASGDFVRVSAVSLAAAK